MTAYLIANIQITNPERYAEYVKAVPATIEAYGGRYLARGGTALTLEGGWEPKRLVVLEFPSMEQARAWWSSDEYRGPKALRHAAAISDVILVEGIPGDPAPAR